MQKDQSISAMLIGISAGPVIEIYTQIMKHFGFTTITASEAISLMWLKEPSLILGILGALGITAWEGIITYQSAKIWGTNYFPIKAMLLGMTIESFVFNIFGTLGGNEYFLIQGISGNYVHTFAGAIAGLFQGFFIKKFIFDKRKSNPM